MAKNKNTPDKIVKDFYAENVIRFLIRRIQQYNLHRTADTSCASNEERHCNYIRITNEINEEFGTQYTPGSVRRKWNSLKDYWKLLREECNKSGQITKPQWKFWKDLNFLHDDEEIADSFLEVILNVDTEPVASTSATETTSADNNKNIQTTSTSDILIGNEHSIGVRATNTVKPENDEDVSLQENIPSSSNIHIDDTAARVNDAASEESDEQDNEDDSAQQEHSEATGNDSIQIQENDDLTWLSFISNQMSRMSIEEKNEAKKRISDIIKK